MTRVSGLVGHRLGLCRKPPAVHTLQAGIGIPTGPAYAGLPEGGGSGPGTIRRGVGAALAGMATLKRNRQLFWFALLFGLVFAGNTLGQALLFFAGHPLQSSATIGYAADFLVEFATFVCLLFLLAGLSLSVPSENNGPVPIFAGLAGSKKYLGSIVVWSAVLALAGLLLFRAWVFFSTGLPPGLRFLDLPGPYLTGILGQFPFNLTMDPYVFTEVPGYGGRSLLLWIYPLGFMWALIYAAINLFLFVLTPFVIPLVVLEHKTLREAVAGSFGLMKKAWAEVAACAVFLGLIVAAVFLAYLLVQAAHGQYNDPWMAWPPGMVTSRPTDLWIALGLCYYAALAGVVFVLATVAGIAAQDLCRSAKSTRGTGSPGPR
ncbi:MAG TPA: hypothetical protein VEI81_02690 [Methanoregula sp.]|nr:hypothetical protein [Methanoregula sp.]